MIRIFDKSLLDNSDVFNQPDIGKQLLEIIESLINAGDTIILVYHNSDNSTTQQNILDKKNFPEFKQHWINNIFKN